jgi:hypothetical protein
MTYQCYLEQPVEEVVNLTNHRGIIVVSGSLGAVKNVGTASPRKRIYLRLIHGSCEVLQARKEETFKTGNSSK